MVHVSRASPALSKYCGRELLLLMPVPCVRRAITRTRGAAVTTFHASDAVVETILADVARLAVIIADVVPKQRHNLLDVVRVVDRLELDVAERVQTKDLHRWDLGHAEGLDELPILLVGDGAKVDILTRPLLGDPLELGLEHPARTAERRQRG